MKITRQRLRKIIHEVVHGGDMQQRFIVNGQQVVSMLSVDDGRRLNMTQNAAEAIVSMMHLMHYTKDERTAVLDGTTPIPRKWVPRLVRAGASVARSKRASTAKRDSASVAHDKLLRMIRKIAKAEYKGAWKQYLGDMDIDDRIASDHMDMGVDYESFVSDLADNLVLDPEIQRLARDAGFDNWRLREMAADMLTEFI